MFKIQILKPIPKGAETKTIKGQLHAKVKWLGKWAWLPCNGSGKVIGSSSKWYAKIDGKNVPLAKDKVTAEKILGEKRTKAERVKEGISLPEAKTQETLHQLLERWTSEKKKQGLTSRYAEESTRRVKEALDGLAVESILDFRRLTSPRVATWFSGLKYSPGTAGLYLVGLQGFGKWLKRQHLVGELPTWPKKSSAVTRPKAAFTKEHVAKLVEVAPEDVGLFYRLAFATISRVGALFSLKAGDFHLDDPNGPWISLRPEHAKTKLGQRIPLPPALAKDLMPLVESANGGQVFPEFGPGNISRRLDIDMKKAGIQKRSPEGVLTAHSFRHGGATHLLKNGVSPFQVMRLGGWKSMAMLTKHYGHVIPMDAQEHVARLME